MHFEEIRDIVIEILQEAEGKFLLPYQIFERIKIKDPPLAQRIKHKYRSAKGKPSMGAGAGIYYSPASFVALALNNFKESHPEIRKEWFDPSDISIKEVQPGNEEEVSIWAWKDGRRNPNQSIQRTHRLAQYN